MTYSITPGNLAAYPLAPMLVLLPPSEGKADPPDGSAPVDLSALIHPELTPQRERLIAALDKLTTVQPARALTALGLSKNQTGEIARNADLLHAPAAPAAQVYTGVLYQHLDLASLSPAAHRRAAERVLIASALWGVVGLGDRIPSYRLKMGAKLPRIKSLAAYWRPVLAAALPPAELIVDMRSGGYAAAWTPAEGTVVNVRAFVESGGQRRSITHMAKAVRGQVARTLVEEKAPPHDPESIAAAVESTGARVELTSGADPTWNLDVIQVT